MVSAHRYVRFFLRGRSNQALEHIPFHHVVRIHKADIRSRSRCHAAVPCCGDARVPLVQKDDSAVLFFPAQQMCPGLIRGAVIDADNFYVPESLAYQALQAAVHVSGYIVAGNNDGNGYAHGGSVLFYPD